ncbi:MAG TPA: hypothetical protein VG318_17045 [Actinomycetota bacterium]|nr:hypothetical protein [Actinomycetota bacterium]
MAGAFIAAILVYVVPPLAVAQRSGNLRGWSWTKAWLTLALVVVYSLIGGAGPFILAGGEADTAGKALMAGLQAQALLKAIVAAGEEATAPVPQDQPAV